MQCQARGGLGNRCQTGMSQHKAPAWITRHCRTRFRRRRQQEGVICEIDRNVVVLIT